MSKFSDYNFKDQKALVRVDFNVPLNDKMEITSDARMRAAVPTIKKILADGGKVILMSHLGRPKTGPEDKFSLRHLVNHLSELLSGTTVLFANDCIGEQAYLTAGMMKPGEVLLLENLRFYKEEEKGDIRINTERSREAIGTGATVIASACPYCNTMLTDGVKGENKEDVQVLDVAELVAQSLE
jgi:3-phosphoglycerate kinase